MVRVSIAAAYAICSTMPEDNLAALWGRFLDQGLRCGGLIGR
jgi:hypothetical protein